MDKKINLEKLKEYVGTDEMFFNHAAFKGDEIEEFDPDSMDIEAALKKYDKLYLELVSSTMMNGMIKVLL